MGNPVRSAKVGTKLLKEKTGASSTHLTASLRKLEKIGYIRKRFTTKKHGQYGVNRYELLNPSTREPLIRDSKKALVFANGLEYFRLPSPILMRSEKPWSVANLKSKDFSLLLALLLQANLRKSLSFKVTRAVLKPLGRTKTDTTFNRAMSDLESLGLLDYTAEGHKLAVHLHDPLTGEPLVRPSHEQERDPANYVAAVEGSKKTRRADFNLSLRELREIVAQQFPHARDRGNDEVLVRCVFHSPDRTPSLFVNVRKRTFYCHGCGAKGTVSALISHVTGGVLQARAAYARASGQEVTYSEPHANALKYEYLSETGKTCYKTVYRIDRPKEEGGKIMWQRAWTDNKKGTTYLYHHERVQFHNVIAVVEGEKCADAVTDAGLDLLGVTTGGATSWDASVAKHLTGKKVFVLPDGIAEGAAYARDVIKSLEAERIPYKLVSFAGTGFEDVADYLEVHTKEELARLIDSEWLSIHDPFETEPVQSI